MSTTYNINELLELQKSLMEKIRSFTVSQSELLYKEETIYDHSRADSSPRVIKNQDRVDLGLYVRDLFSAIDQLVNVKAAIQRHNTEQLLTDLHERSGTRVKLEVLKRIKQALPKNRNVDRHCSREDSDGVALETVEVTSEPMFPIKDVETMFDRLASTERKLNTKIQLLNLEAKIEL